MLLPAELRNQDRTGPSTADRVYSWFKRGLDIVLSSIGLLVLAPVFALLAIVIKIDSRGPVFYAQERIGLNRRRSHGNHRAADERRRKDTFGRPFKIYKLRTMVADAEKNTGPIWAKAGTSIETVSRKLQYDLYYVRHGRLMLDFKIMVATLKVMARGEGAH
jgi:lipopolysaccharide/colanic/teichoic acid biosynthesis glycosyltransferase